MLEDQYDGERNIGRRLLVHHCEGSRKERLGSGCSIIIYNIEIEHEVQKEKLYRAHTQEERVYLRDKNEKKVRY